MKGFELNSSGEYQIELDPDDKLPFSIQWYDFLRGSDLYWSARTFVRPGETYTPSQGALNGHRYRCTTGGRTSTSEPTWPTTGGGTVTDGGVTWTEIGAEDTISTSTWEAGDLTDTSAGVDSTARVTTVILEGTSAGVRYTVTNSIVSVGAKEKDQSFVVIGKPS